MNATTIMLYVLTEFGFVYVLGHSTITLALRETMHDAIGPFRATRRLLVQMIECPACLGFHIGWIVGLVAGLGWRSILAGFFTSGANVVLGKFTRLMD